MVDRLELLKSLTQKKGGRDGLDMKIFIILPAYNEERSLEGLLHDLGNKEIIKGTPFEIVVVDDGSSDRTPLVAEKAAKCSPLVLIQHKRNLGLAAALRTGLFAVLKLADGQDLIVTMDADNTHPPKLVPQMVQRISEGYDVVIASRFRKGAVLSGVPWTRKVYSQCARGLFGLLLPIEGVRDYSCGYRVYRASVLQRGVREYGKNLITETGYSCMADLLLKLAKLPGVRMSEVPLELHYEQRGKNSKMRVGRTICQTLMLIFRRRLGSI
ncbi:MAG TPA: dolichol-phosphate mannosyltransferase [Candidatus Andersenbacteria bacterium]|nr:MAG: Dolichol-phosphate mannosyltransferase [Parcubacteria group bacterium GW2011_GWA2_45_14]HBE90434.1 dolichol-phosphate mannosyltransferase [Candidatus Andersenbacteria bacterium]